MAHLGVSLSLWCKNEQIESENYPHCLLQRQECGQIVNSGAASQLYSQRGSARQIKKKVFRFRKEIIVTCHVHYDDAYSHNALRILEFLAW